MDTENTQSLIRSRTIIFLLSILLARVIGFLTAHYGIPLVPDDVQGEIVGLLQYVLEAFITFAIFAAIWFRKKATAVIDRWF